MSECAVKSDKTAACINARKIYAEMFNGVVTMNHQAHVADVLIGDFGNCRGLRMLLISYVRLLRSFITIES